MSDSKKDKIYRILELYTKLLNGESIKKSVVAKTIGVNERSIQRDIEDIWEYLSKGIRKEDFTDAIAYDHKEKNYYLLKISDNKLSEAEAVIICKLLIESRAFSKKDILRINDTILKYSSGNFDKKEIKNILDEEYELYDEDNYKVKNIEKLLEIYKAIRTKSKLKIEYNNEISVIIPTMLIFDKEILLVGFLENEDGLMQENEEKSYRINKIRRMKTLGRHNIKFNEKKLILNKKGL